MEEPGFWDDADRATKLVQEAKNLKDTVELYRGLEQQYEDIQVMIEMGYEEEDPSLIPEIQEMLDEFTRNLEKLRMETLLSGEYDKYNAILRLNAGAGGTESCDWCSMLYRMYTRWADRKGFSIEILDYLDGTISLGEAVYIIKRDTRHFAKRQLTWFKRERDVRFIAMDDGNAPWVKLQDGTGQPEDDQQKILTYICNDYFGGRNKHGIE